jgi:hypothetical protein
LRENENDMSCYRLADSGVAAGIAATLSSASVDLQHHAMLAELGDDRGRRPAVGENGVDILQAAEAHHGAAAELGVVGDQEDLPRVGDDAARRADFPVVESRRTIRIDAADADDAKSTANWPRNRWRLPTTPRSLLRHGASFEILILAENARHLQIVSDDPQTAMAEQARHLRRGADG